MLVRAGEADKAALAVVSYTAARTQPAKDDVIEVPLGKTPKLTGGSFLPPNANPNGRSFAAAFPKRWEPPGTSRQRARAVLPQYGRPAADSETRACRSAAGDVLTRLGGHSHGLALRDGTRAQHLACSSCFASPALP